VSATVARPVPVRPLASPHLDGGESFEDKVFSQSGIHFVNRAGAIMAEIQPVDAAKGLADDADPHTLFIQQHLRHFMMWSN
jgi:hypothetical protein